VIDVVGAVQVMAVVEAKREAREAWLAAHPEHPAWAERRRIADEAETAWEGARLVWLETARIVRSQAMQMVAADRERLAAEAALDLAGELLPTEGDYRRQWGRWFEVNPDPCPF
jgi:ribosomal protein L16/L10AE